jgi:hypothetical protein
MDFSVSCRCGKAFPVTEGAAGSSLECPCGATVRVPSLNELRRQGLAEQVNPILEIEYLVARGDLPGGHECCQCGRPTDEIAGTVAQCETTRLLRGGWLQGVFWFFVFVLGGWIFLLLHAIMSRSEETVVGKELSVAVPLRMCAACRNHVLGLSKGGRQTMLSRLLAKTPVYRRLLNRYPEAQLLLLSSASGAPVAEAGSSARELPHFPS